MKAARCLVTGGAGFIGSNLVDRLLQAGHQVTIFDNFSLGKKEFIAGALRRGAALITGDLLHLEAIVEAARGQDWIFHMAANSDIDFGRRQTDHDLRQGTVATYNVLEAMRRNAIGKIAFASSSAIYGETGGAPIHEDYGPLLPISFYGASKLACEALISAFCHNYGFQAWIFRFANIVGKNATHGALFDFVHKLLKDPKRLDILGDGKQSKPYLLVDDCVEGMLYAVDHAHEPLNIFNLACEGGTEVRAMAEIVAEEMGLSGVEFCFAESRRGWAGDVPLVRMDPGKLARLGWKAKRSSTEAVRAAARDLIRQARGV
jgi:UDP-glucose 4-epimerase